ncbi:MAG: sigma-54 dependent transcriptional regulator [Pelovirga sp.]
MPFSLMIVDDDPSLISSVKRLFHRDGIEIHAAKDGQQALNALEKFRIDTAVVDLKMPGMSGMDVLREIRRRSAMTRVLMLTGHGGVSDAVEAMQIGADDFLQKPFCPEGLREKVFSQIEVWKAQCQQEKRFEKIKKTFSFVDLIGESPAMIELKELVVRVGASDVSVVIEGESGTGKELVAQALHAHSTRKSREMVAVDCASLGETLMQSELFGHTKGAFTGALSDNRGLLRSADKSSLFLDEIGEMELSLQARLLRCLQEKSVRPVGCNRTYDIDIRVISATNRNLTEAVANHQFREDLYYRLNTVLIQLPPLRERQDDIPLLIEYFMKKYTGKADVKKHISKEALHCLCHYNWPGNVRELANVIARAVVICSGNEITPAMLPNEIYRAADLIEDKVVQTNGDRLDDYEKAAIINALKKSHQVKFHAAKILEIGEATLYRKLRKHGLF